MAKGLRIARRYWKLIAVSCFSLSIAMALGVLALSLSNSVLLLPPSGAEPDRLVMIYSHSANEDIGKVSYPDYEYFRKNNLHPGAPRHSRGPNRGAQGRVSGADDRLSVVCLGRRISSIRL